eukprot:c19092_g1_i1 orf=258-587(+)
MRSLKLFITILISFAFVIVPFYARPCPISGKVLTKEAASIIVQGENAKPEMRCGNTADLVQIYDPIDYDTGTPTPIADPPHWAPIYSRPVSTYPPPDTRSTPVFVTTPT